MGKLTAPAVMKLSSGFTARTAWPLVHRVLHLNHGSFGAVPNVALEAQGVFRADMESAPVPWFISLPTRLADARRELSARIKVPSDSFVFVPNASAGASVVYNSLTLDAGSEVLVTNHGYGAVTMGAVRMAQRQGATVRTVDIPLGSSASEVVDIVVSSFTPSTRFIVIDQVTSPTAMVWPVVEISLAAQAQGIRVLVDGAHAPGLIDDPTHGMVADYWIGNFHKWGCGPRGTAALVAKPEVANDLFPLIDSWGAPFDYPERFDHQGTLDLTSYLAAVESWDFIEETWGWPAVRDYSRQLVSYAEEIIAEAFEQITGENHHSDNQLVADTLRIVKLPPGLVASNDDGNYLRNLMAEEYATHAAFTSFHGEGYMRLSAHVYNTAAEYEEFAERVVPALCKLAEDKSPSQNGRAPAGVR